jgi:hypothetical protein
MLTGLIQHFHRAKFLLNENSTTILTAAGVAGTVSTAVLTGRATLKATELIEHEKKELGHVNGRGEVEVTLPAKVWLVWRFYIPPFGVGVATITCIIAANKIASKKIAALAVAGGISERALQEYKSKVVERLGHRENTKIRDEIAQDRVNKHPVNQREVILAGTGEVLLFDMTTGRYFQSTVEDVKRAENKINHTLNNFMYASLSEFYDEIGLPPTSFSDSVGWNGNNHLEIIFSAVMSTDQRPCIAIDFKNPPTSEYTRALHD